MELQSHHPSGTLSQALAALARCDDQHTTRRSAGGSMQASALRHRWSRRESEAIEVALVTRRPLLIRGEPGCGKTQIASAAAAELGWALHAHTVHPRMEPQDVIYRFDAVERLAYAQLREQDKAQLHVELASTRFYEPGPIWWALDWKSAARAGKAPLSDEAPPVGHVVLIDEIDKADADLPNSLLELFGERQLTLPCAPHQLSFPAQDDLQPLVIITTNEDRELPMPFQRRCVVLSLEPQPDSVAWLVNDRGCAHFDPDGTTVDLPRLSRAVMEAAAQLLVKERAAFKAAALTPPGVAEYLDLLHALQILQQQRSWPDDELVERMESTLARFLFRKHGGVELPGHLKQTYAGSGEPG